MDHQVSQATLDAMAERERIAPSSELVGRPLSTDTPFLREIEAASGPVGILNVMRGNVQALSTLAQNARDAIAFLDAHKVYIQFEDGVNKLGGGWVGFDEEKGCWVAKIRRKADYLSDAQEDAELCTLAEAIDAFMTAHYWTQR